MGSVDLAMLDEFGSKNPYKKGGKQAQRASTAPQKKRPTVMEVRKLDAMLQVAREERREWEEKNKVEKKELMELRQATAAMRKEKEGCEDHSELGSLRDDNSSRSNSLRRAMSGSSETSQGITKGARAINRKVVKATQQTMPPPREGRGPWPCKKNKRTETALGPLQTKQARQARRELRETLASTSWTVHLLSCRKRRLRRGDYQSSTEWRTKREEDRWKRARTRHHHHRW